MSQLDYFSYKIIDYIVNVVLAERKSHFRKRDVFNKEFNTIFIILLITFTIGLFSSVIISYYTTGLLSSKNELNLNSRNQPFLFQTKITQTGVQQNIMTRNIFNHEGEIPFEDTPEGSEGFIAKNFEKAPCSSNDKFPLEVIGIIYTGNPETSFVSIKDPTAAMADVYKVGQELIDNEAYSVYKIPDSRNVQFRHDRIKICIELTPAFKIEGGAPSISSRPSVTLTSSFVTEQLGPGFSKILNSARMIPEIIDGKTVGFKIFAIAKDSLFDKIQLVNGDVIKNINGINLQDSSQGFKIYEAFQDENTIVLEIQRNGQTTTKRVSVQ